MENEQRSKDATVEAGDTAECSAGQSFDIPLGLTRGLSNELYHSDRSAVSSTKLKAALLSGAHYLAAQNQHDVSEALLWGSVLHAYVLEPDRFDRAFFAMPKVNRNTKAGKALAAALGDAAGNRVVFPTDWLPPIQRIRENIVRHREAQRLTVNAEAEVAFVWVDQATGIKCKIKVDLWSASTNEVTDLKSTVDVTADAFSATCAKYQYHLSAAMYLEGVYRVTGERCRWSFIACEKDAPNSVAVYRPTDAFLRRGLHDFRRALDNLARWRDSGVYPGLQAGGSAEYIDLPGWY